VFGEGPIDSEFAIETTGLTKHLGHTAVVDGLDLVVPSGSVYGFLGPNGSGKTTTIRMLLGLIWPSGGSYRLLGKAMPAANASVLPHVGALVEGPAFYPWLTGRQNLKRLDAAGPDGQRRTRRARIDAALAKVGLSAAATKRYRAYSLGMKQRLGLAAALLRPRSLLVLDEPTNGMDPQGTREIRNLVRELAAEGSTVFLSTHLLSEVEQLCTHVGIISVGKLVAQGSIEELRGSGDSMLRVETEDATDAAQVLEHMGLESIIVTGEVVSAQLDGQRPEECNRALVLAGVGVRSLTTDRRSLEDAFVALTGEGFDVAH
jgi:ABC-2 type transport system ATP-binding protein